MDTSLHKDVSTFSSLYRNVSTFLSQGILLISFRMWMHLYTKMFPHFRYYIGMYPNFSQGLCCFLLKCGYFSIQGCFHIFVPISECIHIFEPGNFIDFPENVDTSLYKDVSTF